MDIALTPLENTLKELLLDVAQYIRENDVVAGGSDVVDRPETVLRFTGGWVRDKLLGVDSHDIDVGISSMTGYQFGMALKQYLDVPENLKKYKENHPDGALKEAIVSLHKIDANPEKSKHLETVTTKIFGLDIDLVNLRKETYSEDSRNPQMEFGTAEEDALRRDATINALFYNLNESKLEDLTGSGIEDMKAKLIRTPLEPYQTFKDDPLRVLRLIRFASRLGYRIDADTEKAMQNSDIRDALRLKISKERVGKELESMLRGPDPWHSLQLIDRLELYTTIFANHQDDVIVDLSSWSLAYEALERLLRPVGEGDENIVDRVCAVLVRDANERFYAWLIAAFAPWSLVPGRIAQGPKAKPLPPRTVEVARDSLRSGNNIITVLRDSTTAAESIIDTKFAYLQNNLTGSPAEIRQHIGLCIRSWKKDWRLCTMLAILQEVMGGHDFLEVVGQYDKFLSYIVENNLEDVCDMKPIVNGGEILEALQGRKGPWMARAQDMVVHWQLLHPEITDKKQALDELIKLRAAAHAYLQGQASQETRPEFAPDGLKLDVSLESLWQDISLHSLSKDIERLESLLVAQGYLRTRGPQALAKSDEDAANRLYEWVSTVLRVSTAVSIIAYLHDILPIEKASNTADIIVALASCSSEKDPWTTLETRSKATALLRSYVDRERAKPNPDLWTVVEKTLRQRIRPLFAKTQNPAITAAGRKNFHPVPLPRFDTSTLDPETKPWKIHDVYSTTVFAWLVAQYLPADYEHLERHFPLLVPPMLTLIDDDNISFKTRGCDILSQLLWPIKESKSSILQRTNLSSVFEEAIVPCLLSLPTITPEDESIQLLAAAYPALLSLFKTSYQNSPAGKQLEKDKEKYISSVTKILRDNVISSFHHISSMNPTSTSSFASFPHPRLSTLLVDQITIIVTELQIHTTKYLQEIIPLVYSTLTNPFGTAYLPLLLSAVSTARAVILNAHPRIWRWRGELLGGVCSCWIHVLEEETQIAERKSRGQTIKEPAETLTVETLGRLKKQLKGAVYLLKFVLENPGESDLVEPGQKEAKESISDEFQTLVNADERLRDLLALEIDMTDVEMFGMKTTTNEDRSV
ncbi:hypothetical protein ASPZODRAFT_55687 [Penicilliopsis zonata CBS 506.65]|uniref:Poly A polymerase head domain-containing protein n=1 Tax=Penicilliopsis zonata CBS 506.65 TaxID=1073090 RepID=A0A1L9SVN6_9EURO|nr:hypothetical protein ASPZODRAFT_55687 [Penicilliopsis zonata CBS 506.65]OJJ51248.1 hypothetical protein ASPZODRAFT_55687 [Penicilliopsis zonata CBS 506.65]